ncbi:MAG TPA: phosphatidylinositol mannoside acyltransferase [Acidimicrobiia bacterium]|nr:phosphatidylinositol mannoside acyltransferase [Acidimicrobiia bacterium]
MAEPTARAAYLGYRAAAEVARVFPPALTVPLAEAASRLYEAVNPARRAQVARNLARVAGGPLDEDAERRAVHATFRWYGRYWWELFRLAAYDPGPLLDGFVLDGRDRLDAALDGGRGAVIALPHLGNWDLAGAWFAHQGYPVTAVTEPVEPPELFDWFVATRARLGIRVIALGPTAAQEVLHDLHEGRVVALVCDRDITGDGVPVDFFGETTTLPGGPALLALRSGAPLLPAATYFDGDRGHRAELCEPLPAGREGRMRDDVTRVTQLLAHRFETLIRDAPEQWLMMQPNWPSDHPGAR